MYVASSSKHDRPNRAHAHQSLSDRADGTYSSSPEPRAVITFWASCGGTGS